MKWEPPSDSRKISTIDAHAAGEPLRVVTGSIDPIPGKTILEKRRYAQENLDNLRRSLMFEPRGHSDMYGAIVTEPVTEDGDIRRTLHAQRGLEYDVRPRHNCPCNRRTRDGDAVT